MQGIWSILNAFFKGVCRSRVSLLGALLTTATFPFLLGLVLIDAFWHISNPYLGAVIYMILGPAFMLGLVMVFVGLFFLKGRQEVRIFTLEYLRNYFTDEDRFNRVRKLIFLGIFLSGINLFVFSLLGYSGYHYLESNNFCGQFCHVVMEPEYTAYQNSPHSRVDCVECHIGTGATWFVKSKISGARQLFAVALGTHSRPIETPVHGLRPARETCEQCHRPDRFHGDKLHVIDKYLPNEQSSHIQTVMLMKIGTAGHRSKSANGIHWHVAPENKITYKADSKRLTIPEVTLTRLDGSQIVYRAESEEPAAHLENREMDCMDCHNRPSHIYRSANEALDERIIAEEISSELPFIKRQALEAISADYPNQAVALTSIDEKISSWYRKHYPQIEKDSPLLLKRSIVAIQDAYAGNVWPEMNITWDVYVNHLGHGEEFDRGCFRCHDGNHVADNGEAISSDCNTCHITLAEDESNPDILETLRGE